MNGLRPHQHVPVEHLLKAFQRFPSAVDLSDTGTGKTYVAAAVAKSLGLPTLVVGPKISETAWKTAAAHFNDTISFVGYEKLRTGRTPYGKWDNTPPPGAEQEKFFVCQSCQLPVDLNNFQPCYTHPRGIHCLVEKKRKWKYGRFHFAPQVGFVIFDEVHRCGGLDTLNAEMLIAARRESKRILGLSATAACSPLQMKALGYALGLHNLNDFYRWVARYGCRRDINLGPGLHWMVGQDRQQEVMNQIRASLIPLRGVRVRTEDIPGFPEREISAELYDLDEYEKINSLYSEMAGALQRLETQKSNDVAPESPLTKILRAHQKIELLKVPIAIELVRDYIAKGFSVGVFCNYRQTIEELSFRLGVSCIIDGNIIGQKREQNICDFQTQKERVALLNSRAGGICVSLHDLTGHAPRIGVVFPCFDIVTMRQLMGRFHRDGGKSKCFYRVMFAAGTVEQDMFHAWRKKGNNLDRLNDGDLAPAGISLKKVLTSV